MRKDNVIGVLGGMGPYAGLDLVKKIFDHTLAHSDHTHLPVAMLSYPERIPDRASFLFGQIQVNPADSLAEIARQLEGAGAVVAGIPCNTAHAPAIYDVMVEQLRKTGNRIRMVHMIEETTRFLRDEGRGVERVGVLSTTAVYRLRMYADALEQAGFTPVALEEDAHEELVNETIYNEEWGIKGIANPVSERARTYLLEAIRMLGRKGAQAVILGCTELPLAVPEPEIDGMMLVDPTVVLARALIRETYPEQLRPLETHAVSMNGAAVP